MKHKIYKLIKMVFNVPRNKTYTFINSRNYWEDRYKKKGTSGAGSYGRLALYKAEFLNSFVEKEHINSVLELGSGDGNQLKLAKYPKYTGIDVSKTALKICKTIFKTDKSKSFYFYDDFFKENTKKYQLVLSLDVIYHLIEDEVFYAYMDNLFAFSEKFVVIYASNKNKVIADHVKSRKFTDYVDLKFAKVWELYKHEKNRFPFDPNDTNTSMSDFYIYKRK